MLSRSRQQPDLASAIHWDLSTVSVFNPARRPPPRPPIARPGLRAFAVALLLVIAAPAGRGATVDAASPTAAAATAVTVSGTFHAVATDDFRSRAETILSLETVDGRIPLTMPAGQPLPKDGATVRVQGVRRADGTLAATSILETAGSPPATTSEPGGGAAAATRSVLVIIARFTGESADPVTPAQAAATFTGAGPTVQAFYGATSRGRVTTATTIIGPFDLGIGSTCDPWTVWSAGDAIAVAHGYNPNAFSHVVIWTGEQACGGWVGVGTVGGNSVWINYAFPGGSGGSATMTVIASHEMGHNLGMLHASSYPCWDGSGNQVRIGGTCSPVEYGDPFSLMGQGYSYQSMFDSGELALLGWLASGETQDVTSVGSYALVQTYSATAGVRLVRVPRRQLFPGTGAGSWWLEIRGALAGSFDRFGSGSPVTTGVSVRFGGPPAADNTYLIDATPTGTGGGGATFTDAPFLAGQTFADPAGGLTIRVDAAGATGATVTIGDTEPPTTPGSLGASADVGGMRLDWHAASDNLGLAGYVVRRDGLSIATVPASTLVYVDGGAAPGSSHTYEVAALDTAGLEGPAVSIATSPPSAPGAPTSVTAIAGDASALVSWSAPADTGGSPISGYTVTSDPDGQTCVTTGARTCTVNGLANGTAYTFTVIAANVVGPGPASSVSDPVTPRVAPQASITALPTWTVSPTIALAWNGSPGSATVASFDVRYRRAAWNGAFGSYGTWRTRTAGTSGSFSASAGYTYCFSALARDVTAVVSAWTAETCTAVPLDDRSLSRSGTWTVGTGSSWYRSTYVRSSASGAKLIRTGVRARSIAIVATTCPTCGKVRVYWGSTVLRTINLASATTVNRKVILVTTFPSARSGTLTLRVWSSGRRVIIDGVGVRGL